MKDQLTSFDAEPFLSMCAWCGKTIPDDTECFALGGKAKPEVGELLREHEGRAIIMLIGNREVPCIVTTRISQAKKDGKDFIFALCTEQCGRELKATFLAEADAAEDLPLDSFGEN
jgi:hypothetical protein